MIKAFDETLKHALDECEKRDGSDSLDGLVRLAEIEYNICQECGGSGRTYHYEEDDVGFPCGWCNGKGHKPNVTHEPCDKRL